ncbi:MAG: hypothetical protein AB7O13_13460 [Alphaproteobacteria bacterium]
MRVFRDEDGSFAIGLGRIRVAAAGEDMVFVTGVIEVLGRLAHLPEGDAALRRGDDLNAAVLIIKPAPPTEPANAWTIPDDIAASSIPGLTIRLPNGGVLQGTGSGCGSTIAYDPGDWAESERAGGPGRTQVLLTMLEQANANAAGKSNPLRPDWGILLRL